MIVRFAKSLLASTILIGGVVYCAWLASPAVAAPHVPAETHFTVFAYTAGVAEPIWHSPILLGRDVEFSSENGTVYYKWISDDYRSHQVFQSSGFLILICEDRDAEE